MEPSKTNSTEPVGQATRDRIAMIARMYGASRSEGASSQPMEQEKMQKMEFRNEAEVQTAIAAWLEERGDKPQREINTPGACIDLLSRQYVIEVKRHLTRHNLLQAVGQVMSAAANAPGRVNVVAGLTPTKDKEKVFQIAENLRRSGIQVWFVDQGETFLSCAEQTDLNESVCNDATTSTEPESDDMTIWPILDRIQEIDMQDDAAGEACQSLGVCIEYLCDRLLANEDRIAELEAR